ncbi:STAS domain-containing protein [Actinomadura sp. NPDC048955]|uniref:STAS domain-containing protein n=1 Tax=Actinomadura TaxID=1988 RepID=UPI00216457C3|nr:STAS domain-containing protein [Actinomadura glauciflava]MCR3743231.1 anti-sigma B factor antagonist [Actinomadura glauciflava]
MTEETRRTARAGRRPPEVRCRAGAVQAATVPDAFPGASGAYADDGLRIETARVEAGTAVVAVAGEIDLRTAGPLRDRLVETHGRLSGTGPRRLVADFAAVPFCDAAGLGALVAAHNQISAAGGEIALAGVRPAQLRLFKITGLHRLFAIHRDVEAALSGQDSPTRSG